MNRLALAAAFMLASITAALAQNVTVIGPITPGDCAMFNSVTVVKDAGFPCPGSGGTLNLPNGTTATTQNPFSDNTTKVATDAFVQGAISLNSTHFSAGGTSTGSANAQVISSVSPPVFSLVGNPTVTFTAGFSNSGATTLNVASSGAISVLRKTATGLVALVTGDIIANQQYLVTYDGTQYELQTPSALLPAAASVLGGVFSVTCSGLQSIVAITTTGSPTCGGQAVNAFTINHTIATTDSGNIVQMGTGSTGLISVTLPSVSGFTAPSPITIENNDTTRSKLLVSFPTECLNSTINDGTHGLLFPLQSITVAIINGAWHVTSCPGRWRPTSAVVFTVDTGGSDSTGDALTTGGATSFLTIQHCMNVVAAALDYSLSLTQPTCGPTSGQTFTESDIWATPPVGTNTLNITGQGGAFTWKPSGANPYVLLVGNNANVQITNATVSGTGTTCFSAVCELLKVHNSGVLEPLTGVTCNDAGAGGFCIRTDQNTAGGGHVNVDNGMTVSGTIGTVAEINGGSSLNWNSILTASSVTLTQVFAARGPSIICVAGNFGTAGTGFGTARQWAVLNNAVLANVSGTAIPGSTPGINTAATFAAGIIVNSGTSAGGC